MPDLRVMKNRESVKEAKTLFKRKRREVGILNDYRAEIYGGIPDSGSSGKRPVPMAANSPGSKQRQIPREPSRAAIQGQTAGRVQGLRVASGLPQIGQ